MSTPLYEIVRVNIKDLMAHRRINGVELAEKAGVTPGYVSHILTGYRNPGLEAVDRFAAALGVSPDYLLRSRVRRAAKSA